MAVFPQIVPTFINLTGDGVTTSFLITYSTIKGFFSTGNIVSTIFPTSVAVNNPPFPVSNVAVDVFGNTTLNLMSPLGLGVQATFELDFTISVAPTRVSGSVYSVDADEFGNLIPTSNDVDPWRQSLLDEMRAIRMGIQVLCDYMNPASGLSTQTNMAAMLRDATPISRIFSNEVDLLAWAQSVRDGSDEVIQG